MIFWRHMWSHSPWRIQMLSERYYLLCMIMIHHSKKLIKIWTKSISKTCIYQISQLVQLVLIQLKTYVVFCRRRFKLGTIYHQIWTLKYHFRQCKVFHMNKYNNLDKHYLHAYYLVIITTFWLFFHLDFIRCLLIRVTSKKFWTGPFI